MTLQAVRDGLYYVLTVWGPYNSTEASAGAFDVSQHQNPQVIYALGFTGIFSDFTGNRRALFRSTNSGTSYAQLLAKPNGQYFATDLHIPYNNNSDDDIFWGMGSRGDGDDDGFRGYYSTATGAVNRSPGDYAAGQPYSILSFVNDRTLVYCFGFANAYNAAGALKFVASLWRSTDEGVSWTQVQASTLTDPRALGIWPYDGNKVYFLESTIIRYSTDGGVTLTDQTGDWSTSMGGAFANPVMIVPVWIN